MYLSKDIHWRDRLSLQAKSIYVRYFLEISYKGTNYHGWQIQQNAVTIQEVVQLKLKQLLGYEIEIVGSGRTDAGVHARQQFFHADFEEEIDSAQFAYKLNAVLPDDMLISSIRKVAPEAHARFDATRRAYDYLMVSRKDPFLVDEAYIYHRLLDIDILNSASEILIGKHNFESFSKVKTQVNNFSCEVYQARWKMEENKTVFHIEANRFLRGMVRAIVGTLLMVNEGKISIHELEDILKSLDRTKAGRSVSPNGLYLSKVIYPEQLFIE